MIVCHCNAVSDRIIRKAVEVGAESIEEVTDLCGAGGDCGGCKRSIDRILEQCRPVQVLLTLAS